MEEIENKTDVINKKECRCACCHAVLEPNKFEIEHIRPKDGVEPVDMPNVILLCQSCNRKIHSDEKSRLAGSSIGGAVLGASIAGPFGAIVGGVFGLLMGDSVNKSKKGNIDG
ncbi:HNH endonuclease [Vibrio parahaemolyticus]|uniref:HNH endonuclease signature motif containing protein n=1 Tax=Vibrio parahaemolyticus TaxID=670 RepID=UPI000B78C5C5|nr:HNH endonuclease signature motif containing protein [Vibrio parahaemolyticus]EGQ8137045.1 hypothetical protein [Vibrio parahaemolyticus]EGQ8148721.1 hypothetical protein [Vibrio parahaemolyticus]EGQ8250567.1 hypothetical protein [Vibrio parahaemolyticus]EGQ8265048.1 hypothetical protein [Vibrio parahaemolyticus]EGQ8270766.1 hypothetical protein [Vibrio parahaemolyticus]